MLLPTISDVAVPSAATRSIGPSAVVVSPRIPELAATSTYVAPRRYGTPPCTTQFAIQTDDR